MDRDTYRQLVRRRQAALCESLGLDPATVTKISVDFQAGATVVSWEGVRKLKPEEAADAMEAIAKVVVPGAVVPS